MKQKRLDQLLASLGYGSRRECAAMIRDGRVIMHDKVATDPETRVDSDAVRVDGEPLEFPQELLVMLHKPIGYVCSHSNAEGPTIYELLPPRWLGRRPPVTTIGRLDKDTSGLLLITDVGNLVHKFTSPRAKIVKIYEIEVDALLRPELVELFASGKFLLRSESKPCLPAKLEILDSHHARLHLAEGRYHQVRRMFAAIGLDVVKLHRPCFGWFDLGDLPAGKWRYVNSIVPPLSSGREVIQSDERGRIASRRRVV